MYVDLWMGVVEYLTPMDVICVVGKISKSIRDQIAMKCVVQRSLPSSEHYLNNNGWEFKLSIWVNQETRVGLSVMENAPFFVKLYLKEVSIVIARHVTRDRNSFAWDDEFVEGPEIALLRFYKQSLTKKRETTTTLVEPSTKENNETTSGIYGMFSNLFNFLGFKTEIKKVITEPMKEEGIGNVTTVKNVLIGQYGVGKSTFVRSSASGNYEPVCYSKIGIDFTNLICRIPNSLEFKEIKIQIWDTAGQERFAKSVFGAYLQNAYTCLACFSLAKKESLDSITSKWEEIMEKVKRSGMDMILLGLHPKHDFTKINQEDIYEMCDKLGGAMYFEVDSKDTKNIYVPWFYLYLAKSFNL